MGKAVKRTFLFAAVLIVIVPLNARAEQPYACPYDELLIREETRAKRFNLKCPICAKPLEPIVYGKVLNGPKVLFKNGTCIDCRENEYWATLYTSSKGEKSFDPNKFTSGYNKVNVKFKYACVEGTNLYFSRPGTCPPTIDKQGRLVSGKGERRYFGEENTGREGEGIRNPVEEKEVLRKAMQESPAEERESGKAEFEKGAKEADEKFKKGLDSQGKPIQWAE